MICFMDWNNIIKDWNNIIDKIHFTAEDFMKVSEVIKKIKKTPSVIKLLLHITVDNFNY